MCSWIFICHRLMLNAVGFFSAQGVKFCAVGLFSAYSEEFCAVGLFSAYRG